MTPIASDSNHLAPVQHLLETELRAAVSTAGFTLANRQINAGPIGPWVSVLISPTDLKVWVAYDMAGIEASGIEIRFEAQGYLTPEAFCEAVAQRAIHEAARRVATTA